MINRYIVRTQEEIRSTGPNLVQKSTLSFVSLQSIWTIPVFFNSATTFHFTSLMSFKYLWIFCVYPVLWIIGLLSNSIKEEKSNLWFEREGNLPVFFYHLWHRPHPFLRFFGLQHTSLHLSRQREAGTGD